MNIIENPDLLDLKKVFRPISILLIGFVLGAGVGAYITGFYYIDHKILASEKDFLEIYNKIYEREIDHSLEIELQESQIELESRKDNLNKLLNKLESGIEKNESSFETLIKKNESLDPIVKKYLNVYLVIKQADSESKMDSNKGLELYYESLHKLYVFKDEHPNWESNLIQARVEYLIRQISKLDPMAGGVIK